MSALFLVCKFLQLGCLIFIGFLLHDKSKNKYRYYGCSNRKEYKILMKERESHARLDQ